MISADGRFVAFVSFASNLVPSDTNGRHDVFVHDRATGLTERVSVTSAGGQVGDGSFDVAISGDGRFVGFDSQASNLVSGDTNNRSDVFVHDRLTGTTERVSLTSVGREADNHSFGPSLSADGRFVSFGSLATNLVAGDGNAAGDAFVRDRLTGTTERVNVSSAEGEANDVPFNAALSDNGRVVAFDGEASNLVPGDTNAFSDIFVRDLDTGITERVNVGPAGEQANGVSFSPSLSADGRFVTFDSQASNLVSGDTNATGDVFMRDRQVGTTERGSVGGSGVQGNGQSFVSSLSEDGRIVSFTSEASNLVSADTNGAADVFVRDLTGPPASTPASRAGARPTAIPAQPTRSSCDRPRSTRSSAMGATRRSSARRSSTATRTASRSASTTAVAAARTRIASSSQAATTRASRAC